MVLLGSAGGGGYARRQTTSSSRAGTYGQDGPNGGMRPVALTYEPPFRVGDRVRVFGTQLELLNP